MMRKIFKMLARIYFALTIVILCISIIIAGCATKVVDDDGRPSIIYVDKGINAVDAWNNVRLKKSRALWVEESDNDGDVFSAGFAAYRIASITGDFKWSKEAIRLLTIAKEQLPNFALATAWLGSSHSLAARDFPVQGAWQIIPGPGFIRIYHVWRAESLLNEAVEQDEKNPAVRLIRAATINAMPAILVDHEVAEDDFRLLAKWANDPSLNPDYFDVLLSNDWLSSFYLFYAEKLSEDGESKRSLAYLKKLEKIAPTTELRNLALWKISKKK